MTLSKPVRILVGIATIWYTLYLLLMMVGVVVLLGYVILALSTGGQSIGGLQTFLRQILSFEIMLPIHFCSILLEVGLLIFYLVHTIKNARASDSMRIVLGLGHLFLPFVAMPIYYYLYIRREQPPEWAATHRKVEHLAESVI
jgi:hypothetical protein